MEKFKTTTTPACECVCICAHNIYPHMWGLTFKVLTHIHPSSFFSGHGQMSLVWKTHVCEKEPVLLFPQQTPARRTLMYIQIYIHNWSTFGNTRPVFVHHTDLKFSTVNLYEMQQLLQPNSSLNPSQNGPDVCQARLVAPFRCCIYWLHGKFPFL